MDKKFYITTAIAYTSQKPHIGNAYDPVLADCIARYKRISGYDVFFQTGSDEHGQKIEECAKKAGISPKEYVDKISDEIKYVWSKMNVSYDKFIRTTDPDHEQAIKAIFKRLYEKGDIYKSKYEGKYCVPCESFFTESQLVDGKCPDCGRDVIDSSEEAYFLKLSKYQDRLMDYYRENPDFFRPDSRRAEMINNFLKPGLADLCVSRSSFSWGVPIDFDPGNIVYVWIDALSNYITGIGFDGNEGNEQFKKYWPCDLHAIGKDIVRFHTIYWPIILMALDLELPKQVLGHPWVLFGNDKMSKSKGNVIYADEMADVFGTDAVRYYLLAEIPFAQDGSITYESMISKFNTDLANNLGNLVNRTVSMANKYFDGKVRLTGERNDIDIDLLATFKDAVSKYKKTMDDYHTNDSAECIMDICRRCNKYIDETEPWKLAKDESQQSRLCDVLYNLIDVINGMCVLLYPFMPETAAKIRTQIGANAADFVIDDSLCDCGKTAEYCVGTAEALFARIDADKLIDELTAQAEAKKAATADETNTVDLISIDDFAKVELKIAEITAAEGVPKAKKLLKLTLNDGSATPRTVVSGISQYYTPEDLVGRKIVVVANLKPATLCGVESHGMILATSDEDGIHVLFADDQKPGNRLS